MNRIFLFCVVSRIIAGTYWYTMLVLCNALQTLLSLFEINQYYFCQIV